jgi:hypothetical protein
VGAQRTAAVQLPPRRRVEISDCRWSGGHHPPAVSMDQTGGGFRHCTTPKRRLLEPRSEGRLRRQALLQLSQPLEAVRLRSQGPRFWHGEASVLRPWARRLRQRLPAPAAQVHCPGCGTSRAIDLRKVDRQRLGVRIRSPAWPPAPAWLTNRKGLPATIAGWVVVAGVRGRPQPFRTGRAGAFGLFGPARPA